MSVDKYFTTLSPSSFVFDQEVAKVFDDMISRSVPFYKTSLSLTASLLNELLPHKASLLDLGCSTGSMLSILREDLLKTGVDSSQDMLDIARVKLGENAKLYLADINDFHLEANSYEAIVCAYTMQFIKPEKRLDLIEKIHSALRPNGLFIFCEKLSFEDEFLQKAISKIHEDFKLKQGYSQDEINRKKTALEKVLIAFSEDENRKLLSSFKSIHTLCAWGNFATFLAKKDER